MANLAPTLILLVGALLSALPRRAGGLVAAAVPLLAAAAVPQAPFPGPLFAYAFCAGALLGGVYGLGTARPMERAAGLTLAAAACGVALTEDWVTLFFCWELMAAAGLVLTWAGGPGARGAGLRYLFLHSLGGGCMLAGLLLHFHEGGGVLVAPLAAGGSPAHAGAWLVLAAVLLNAAAPPLHAWLPDAYPRCTPAGSVLQSAFTTKAAVVVLLRAFPGAELLVAVGAFMALYGVAFALLEDDARRLLSYHIVSQVGYMAAGAGLGTAAALDGAALHAVFNILYKTLLFMGAGALVHAAGSGRLSALGGLGRRLPAVFLLYMAGALAISGAPPFNGFASKTLLGAAYEAGAPGWAASVLHLASVGTFLSVGLKLPYFAFLGARTASVRAPVPASMTAAMALAAAACLLTGVAPGLLYPLLAAAPDPGVYSAASARGALELLAGTGLAFWLLRRRLIPHAGFTLDVDVLYRRPAAGLSLGLARAVERAGALLREEGEDLAARAAEFCLRRRGAPVPVAKPLGWMTAAFVLAALAAALQR